MTIGFVTTVKVGDHYRVKVNHGARTSGYALTPATDRTSLREQWMNRPEANKLPFLYGWRMSNQNDNGTVATANMWSRYEGRLYAVFLKYYWSKDGKEVTVQISVRRQATNGYVWTSKRYVGRMASTAETGFMQTISEAIVINSRIAEANAPNTRVRNTGNVGVAGPERGLPQTDWTA